MEYIVTTIILSSIILIILKLVINVKIKDVKNVGENIQLDNLTNAFPENVDICKEILVQLGNTSVNIKEDTSTKTSLYLIASNTISIANIRSSYTRIQTIAHECVHSIQNKRLLWFNFIYSNIYILYFLVSIIMVFFSNQKMYLINVSVLILLAFVYYMIRSFLETDAMTKARYVAKEYMEKTNFVSKEDVSRIVKEYDKLNEMGIKFVNYALFLRRDCKNHNLLYNSNSKICDN